MQLMTTVAIVVLAVYASGTVVNLLCVAALVRYTNVPENPGHLLIITLAISDCLTSVPLAFGCVETLAGGYVHPLSPIITGALTNFSFSCCSLTLVVMAANRFVAIMLPRKFKRIFNPKTTRRLIVVVLATSFGISILHQIVCCRVVWDARFVMSVYANGTHEGNPMLVFDQVLSFVTLGAGISLYLPVCCKIMLYKVSPIDKRLCYQFITIIGFYLLMNVSWYTIPYYVVATPELLYVVSLALAVNFTFNPYVYLLLNPTVRRSVRSLLVNADHSVTHHHSTRGGRTATIKGSSVDTNSLLVVNKQRSLSVRRLPLLLDRGSDNKVRETNETFL